MEHNANKISKGSWLGLVVLLALVMIMGSFLGVDDQQGIDQDTAQYAMQSKVY